MCWSLVSSKKNCSLMQHYSKQVLTFLALFCRINKHVFFYVNNKKVRVVVSDRLILSGIFPATINSISAASKDDGQIWRAEQLPSMTTTFVWCHLLFWPLLSGHQRDDWLSAQQSPFLVQWTGARHDKLWCLSFVLHHLACHFQSLTSESRWCMFKPGTIIYLISCV